MVFDPCSRLLFHGLEGWRVKSTVLCSATNSAADVWWADGASWNWVPPAPVTPCPRRWDQGMQLAHQSLNPVEFCPHSKQHSVSQP